ncbi:GATA zinc finger domain-containing protein 1-like [Mytilus galloprovincialis]|uniref:GATA zinc finger domain-containing protein 1 n=1 Tax=Mytilus edulis TaxID=6550 RepID=A0A8S3RPF0_MYTED|nr:GATAD1 [Mytilus edulis]
MPLGAKPVCISCDCNVSTLWRRATSGDPLCNACYIKQNESGIQTNEIQNGTLTGIKSNGNGNGPTLRKSSRIKPSKHKFISATRALATKGRSRRVVFKKSQPLKAPTAVATVVTGESVFHDGMYYQVGDVVSLVDHDLSVYYAQIRGFMQDQYNEKSAVISWLLPTQNSQEGNFDPTTYIMGPEEDLPRSMEYMEFVCHAPSEYFKCSSGPYPTVSQKPDLCYIWTTTENLIKPLQSIEEVFNVKTVKKEKPAETKPTKVKEKKVEKKPVEKMEVDS